MIYLVTVNAVYIRQPPVIFLWFYRNEIDSRFTLLGVKIYS